MLRIHNTLGNRIETFEPLNPPRLGMYVCGVTVYDTVHVGHARSYVNFDMIRRYLEYSGYQVTFVQNFTDIDDKIIEKSQREGCDWRELTEKYIGEYFALIDKLGVKRASAYPRATEFIKEMQQIIAGLIERGHAYVAPSGDVLFDISTFEGYGALVSKARLEQSAVSRIGVSEDKRNEGDFLLWKKAKPGEPKWPSPWGDGRPGWHIECSAMSLDHLGASFDIHGGGHDLIFPHHTNEIAQSECFTGQPMAKYWIHNGFIKIGDEKMSKSLGNFVTLAEAIERHGAAALRMFFLRTHYRSMLNFEIEKVDESAAAIERLREALADALVLLEHLPPSDAQPSKSGAKLIENLNALDANFRMAMDDDFNTPAALAVLFETAQSVFSYVKACGAPNAQGVNTALLKRSVDELSKYLAVLGFELASRTYDSSRLKSELAVHGFDCGEEDALSFALKMRYSLRKAKNFDAADKIRDTISSATGLAVKDWPFGSTASLIQIAVATVK